MSARYELKIEYDAYSCLSYGKFTSPDAAEQFILMQEENGEIDGGDVVLTDTQTGKQYLYTDCWEEIK
jgi:hypothetical protein